jgi:Ca-activated chloride channel family protein
MKHGTTVIGWAVGTPAGVSGEGVPGLDRTGFGRLSRAGAEVIDLSLGGGDLRSIDRALDRARTGSVDPDDAALWRDDGYVLVPLLLLAVLLWFRPGWVIGRPTGVLVALLWLGGCGSSGGESWWLDLWLTPDQQGRRLFEAGEYAAAAERFEDPMWKGVSYYTAHDWKHAEEQFGRVDSLDALFNLGNAYAQAREIASAIAVYDEVLKRRPTHRGARANRDHFQGILEGLEQTTDFDELNKPDEGEADPTKAQLRKDQLDGKRDRAAEAAEKIRAAEEGAMLSEGESESWMKRVTTTPAEFLRNKFAIQAASGDGP